VLTLIDVFWKVMFFIVLISHYSIDFAFNLIFAEPDFLNQMVIVFKEAYIRCRTWYNTHEISGQYIIYLNLSANGWE